MTTAAVIKLHILRTRLTLPRLQYLKMANQMPDDWKAKLHYVPAVQQNDDESPGPPKTDDEIHSFVQNGGYTPGDVVNFSRERFTFAWMVTRDDSTNRFGLVANPDDSGSGYLTLPEKVLERHSSGDAISKYHALMEEMGFASVIFHLPRSDKLVKDKLGSDIPEGWKFQAEYIDGEMESFLACPPGGADFKQFDFSTLTWDSLQEAFRHAAEEQISLSVTVRLEGDKLAAYKDKYGQDGDKYAWMKALPSLPASWTLTKAGGSAGSTHHTMKWLLKGPQRDEDEVKQRLHNFLEGFDFDMD